MKSLLPKKFHFYIYIFSLLLLAASLPISKYMMSLSQLIMLGNWIIEGGLKNKFICYWKNRPAFILGSLLLLHLIGLIYTSDFEYAFNDIKIKLPLLALPLIISTSQPVSKKIGNLILHVFIIATLLGTAVSGLILAGFIHREITDIRDISVFISHIRFGLFICIAIYVSTYFMYLSNNIFKKIMWLSVIVWFIYFLVLMESMTGLFAFCITLLVLIIYMISKSKSRIIQLGGYLLFVLLLVSAFYYVKNIANENKLKENIDVSRLERYTKHGNQYEHDLERPQKENGYCVWIYYCMKELEESWNQRSKIKIDQKDLRGNDIRYTLIRFLTSKGQHKDADAVNSLSAGEIKAIERGVTNVNYQNISSFRGRIYETLWEINVYKTTGDPNGHSLTQRFEYWKAAIGIIRQNLLIGVGTGDIELELDAQYIKMNSPLLKEWRFHPHNQYLSIAVAFGLIGLIWFLIILFYPMMQLKMTFDFLYATFFIIALISFLNEDTLETQAGVTFYAFFNTFFLFIRNDNTTLLK